VWSSASDGIRTAFRANGVACGEIGIPCRIIRIPATGFRAAPDTASNRLYADAIQSHRPEVHMGVKTAATAEEWQDLASQSFVPLECETPSPLFRASLEDIRLAPGMTVCRVRSDSAVITRTPRLAARAGSDDLHISVQVRSSGRIHQGSRSVAVDPGAVAVYATDQPYRLDYSTPGQRLMVVQVSRAELGLPERSIDSAVEAIGVADTPARRVFRSYLRSVVSTHGELDTRTRSDFARVTADLAASMLRSSAAGRQILPASSESLLYTIRSFVRARAGSADLTIDEIAQAHYISRRKLYDLFAQIQTTPSAYLREQRLQSAARMLTEPGGRDSIAAIALQCGFADVTTFARTFRKRFGMTPRDWRAGH
jgi:AraC-like DNA-binding protein